MSAGGSCEVFLASGTSFGSVSPLEGASFPLGSGGSPSLSSLNMRLLEDNTRVVFSPSHFFVCLKRADQLEKFRVSAVSIGVNFSGLRFAFAANTLSFGLRLSQNGLPFAFGFAF